MKISEIKIQNYKSFYWTNKLKFNKNFIFLVWENNTGKSTLFEAIEFLKSGLPNGKDINEIKNNKSSQEDILSVEIKLQGNIKDLIKNFSETKYEKFVFDEDWIEILRVCRSSEERVITQSGKETKIDIKKITLWNPETNQFENPSGIDSVFKTLFESQFVWADTNPKDIADFWSTKICGRLLNATIWDFFEWVQWKKFIEIHKETFQEWTESLSIRTKNLEEDIQKIILEQYWSVKVKFNFSLPETSSFLKSWWINLDDGIDTKLEEKWTGMQRALALAIIQVYWKNLTQHPESNDKNKPLFLFIDEPEICLHPKAQKQLLDSLNIISSINQVFITSHSPYLLKSFNKDKHELFIFSKSSDYTIFKSSDEINLFPWSPSWWEINHFAYNLETIEFHNELYWYLEEINKKALDWLKRTRNWFNSKYNKTELVSLSTYIRHFIHHPENKEKNEEFTENELKISINEMIKLL